MEILPGILATDELDCKQKLLHPRLQKVAKMFHVDVLDGSMFANACWADPKVVGSWSGLPHIELHCMVQNPLPVAEEWYKHVATLKRIIVHKEIGRSLEHVLAELSQLDLEVLVAINPDTPVDEVVNFPFDALTVMGVQPGKSGQLFLGEPILSKLKRARVLLPGAPLELDGGVSEMTIQNIAQAGATRCVASSALWKAENPVEAYENLLSRLR